MKLRYTYLLAFAGLATLTACDKEEVAPEPALTDKTAVFEVFASGDYTNSYLAEEEATIHLYIYRGEKGVAGTPMIFDSTFVMLLKHLPMEDNKIVIRKTIPDVDTKKEFVSLGSGYRVAQFGYGSYEPVPDDENTKTIEIVL